MASTPVFPDGADVDPPATLPLPVNSSLLEAPLSKTPTVGQLVHQLQTMDPDLPVYLAVNPDWPFAHRIGSVIEDRPAFGSGAVYIAEDGQQEVLSPNVRTQLNWSTA
ncbi:hypothetical protein AB0J38_02340 [Streptomyces sp. NPDC050095]|uniref:hypothetical protein n=1 Tax=unclassified Streptomyces TaxID=2593676 RepID=UPI003437B50E